MNTATPEQRSEFAGRSKEFYRRNVLPKLTKADEEKFVAVYAEGNDFEVDEDPVLACARLRERHPGVKLWMEQAGYAAAYGRLGQRTRVPL